MAQAEVPLSKVPWMANCPTNRRGRPRLSRACMQRSAHSVLLYLPHRTLATQWTCVPPLKNVSGQQHTEWKLYLLLTRSPISLSLISLALPICSGLKGGEWLAKWRWISESKYRSHQERPMLQSFQCAGVVEWFTCRKNSAMVETLKEVGCTSLHSSTHRSRLLHCCLREMRNCYSATVATLLSGEL